jgi:hypothetical protein
MANMKNKPKKIAEGVFTEDIYSVTDRYPLDQGENYTKSQIDAMFTKQWDKGTKLFLWDESEDGTPLLFWYTADGDGGWNAEYDWTRKYIKNTKDLIKKGKT